MLADQLDCYCELVAPVFRPAQAAKKLGSFHLNMVIRMKAFVEHRFRVLELSFEPLGAQYCLIEPVIA